MESETTFAKDRKKITDIKKKCRRRGYQHSTVQVGTYSRENLQIIGISYNGTVCIINLDEFYTDYDCINFYYWIDVVVVVVVVFLCFVSEMKKSDMCTRKSDTVCKKKIIFELRE